MQTTTAKRRAPWVWLVVAAVLLGLGAWLMRGAEPPERAHVDPVRMPERQTREDRQKLETRRTWFAPVDPDAGVEPARPARPTDPVLAIMPAEVKRGALVAEYNAILNSELGPKLTECLFGGEEDAFLKELQDAGLDPINGIDRVAMVDDAVVVTGDFNKVKWKELSSASVQKDYGRNGQLYEVPRADGGVSTFGTWNGQMLVVGRDEAELKTVLDRLEGRGTAARPAVDESMAYGELYGVMAADPIARMLEKQNPELASLITQTAKQVQLHMDVGHDVGMVADVVPSGSGSSTEDLRRSLGAALSLARMKAAAEGNDSAAQLLDLAKVGGASGQGFRLEAGLPHDFMKKALDECIEDRKRPRPSPPSVDAGAALETSAP